MARFFDRFNLDNAANAAWATSEQLREANELFRTTMRDIPVIVADNVADYLYWGTDQTDWDVKRDFPNVAPPFERFWIEYRKPERIWLKGQAVTHNRDEAGFIGCLFGATDVRSEPDDGRTGERLEARYAHESKFYGASLIAKRQRFGADAARHLNEGERHLVTVWRVLEEWRHDPGAFARHLDAARAAFRWRIEAIAFMEHGHQTLGPLAQWDLGVDDHGVIGESTFSTTSWNDRHAWWLHENYNVYDIGSFNQFVFVPLLALSFMHCKNVSLNTVEAPAALQKARRKEHKEPFVRYHTLEIDPMREVLRTIGRSGSVGLQKALHICRGHFADYREGSGLFGSYHGLVWRKAHMRGTALAGEVVKDYAVAARR